MLLCETAMSSDGGRVRLCVRDHNLCEPVTMKFEAAVAATKETLRRQPPAIVAEIDLVNAVSITGFNAIGCNET